MKSETANNLHVLILQKVAERKQSVIAEAIGRDTSTVSRIISCQSGIHIDEIEDFLNVLGLKIIQCDGDTITLPKIEYDALRVIARRGI